MDSAQHLEVLNSLIDCAHKTQTQGLHTNDMIDVLRKHDAGIKTYRTAWRLLHALGVPDKRFRIRGSNSHKGALLFDLVKARSRLKRTLDKPLDSAQQMLAYQRKAKEKERERIKVEKLKAAETEKRRIEALESPVAASKPITIHRRVKAYKTATEGTTARFSGKEADLAEYYRTQTTGKDLERMQQAWIFACQRGINVAQFRKALQGQAGVAEYLKSIGAR